MFRWFRRRKRPPRISLGRLQEPWRSSVRAALLAQTRFEEANRRVRPGPLRDRLDSVANRLGEGVQECYEVARHGQDLDAAMAALDSGRVHTELAGARVEQQRALAAGRGVSPALQETIESLEGQLAAAERMRRVTLETQDRLRLLNAQLDEAVARAVEVSVQDDELADVQPLATGVDAVVGELEALRQGLKELGRAPGR